jgi:predicted transposase YbfD/YdcC
MEISDTRIQLARENLCAVKDFRQRTRNFRHLLSDILFIGFVTILCGLKDYGDMEMLGKAKEQWFRKYLPLRHGIPDKNTFARVFSHINPRELGQALGQWLLDMGTSGGRLIPIDGKTIRGSANGKESPRRHIISAYVNEYGITLAQVNTDSHDNEITEIPKLLDLIDIKGDIVTIDAMGCQTAITAKIIEKKGNYVLAVKENQRQLYQDVKDYFDWLDSDKPKDEPYQYYSTGSEKDHGRIEWRELWASSAISYFMDSKNWKGLKSIIRYRCHRLQKDAETGEWTNESTYDRYYISSLDVSAQKMCQIIREHWSIENNLHWVLDIVFGEDASRVRKDHAPENLNVLRKAAMALIRQRCPEKSRKQVLFNALMDDTFRENLLFSRK